MREGVEQLAVLTADFSVQASPDSSEISLVPLYLDLPIFPASANPISDLSPARNQTEMAPKLSSSNNPSFVLCIAMNPLQRCTLDHGRLNICPWSRPLDAMVHRNRHHELRGTAT